MQQMALAPAASPPGTDGQGSGGADGGSWRMPLGPTAQLAVLRDHLVRCDRAVQAARDRTAAAMRDPDAEERERWEAIGSMRALCWKVGREILPLLARVPPGLRTGPAWTECERAGHVVRRSIEAALRDHANYAVDLAAAAGLPAVR